MWEPIRATSSLELVDFCAWSDTGLHERIVSRTRITERLLGVSKSNRKYPPGERLKDSITSPITKEFQSELASTGDTGRFRQSP
jgi:hypothetical protein